jgi:hypothetical protein
MHSDLVLRRDSTSGNTLHIGLFISIALGFLLTMLMFYPGLTTPDSDFQIMQARSFQFSDGHPPIMALIWSGMVKIHDGPAFMFLSFVTLYWGSFGAIAWSLARNSRPAAVLAMLCAFSPMLLNYAGTIWKDVFVFDLFLAAFAICYWHLTAAKKMHAGVYAVTLAAIIVGSLGRHNSLFSGLPLTMLALYTFSTQRPTTWRGLGIMLLKATALYSVLLLPTHLLVRYITQPTPASVSSSLFIFDLIGISLQTKTFLLPPSKLYDIQTIANCYDPAGWDRVWVACPNLLDEMRANGHWGTLSHEWIEALKAHPMAYAHHRVDHVQALFIPRWLVFVSDVTPLATDYGFVKGHAFLAFDKLMLAMRQTPVLGLLLTNGFWIFANTYLLAWTAVQLWTRRDAARVVIFLLVLSGFVYSAPFLLIGTAPDFRYVYWSIGATLIALIIMLAHRQRAVPAAAI